MKLRKQMILATLEARYMNERVLAESMGISRGYLSDLLNGNRGTRSLTDIAERMAKVLSVDVDLILDRGEVA